MTMQDIKEKYDMNNRKYPVDLFIIGLITNFLFHFFWLFIPAVILLIVGIWVKLCGYIALTLLVIDLILSVVEQIGIRNTFLKDSDDPQFKEFQDIFSKGGDWRENMKEVVEQKIREENNKK